MSPTLGPECNRTLARASCDGLVPALPTPQWGGVGGVLEGGAGAVARAALRTPACAPPIERRRGCSARRNPNRATRRYTAAQISDCTVVMCLTADAQMCSARPPRPGVATSAVRGEHSCLYRSPHLCHCTRARQDSHRPHPSPKIRCRRSGFCESFLRGFCGK